MKKNDIFGVDCSGKDRRPLWQNLILVLVVDWDGVRENHPKSSFSAHEEADEAGGLFACFTL